MKRLLTFLAFVPLCSFAVDTVTIPLQLVTRTAAGGLGFGIECSVGGGPTRLFLLDTGSSGLYAANSIVGSNSQSTGNPFFQQYSSGIMYSGTIYQGSVDFGYGASAPNAIFGDITSATGPTIPPNYPPTTEGFFGTMGASFEVTSDNVYSVFAQMPGNLSSGFIVQSGGVSGTPTLVLGLTPENTQGFISAQLALQSNPTYPNGNTAWKDTSLNVTTNLSFEGVQQSLIGSVIFDTGAPDTEIHPTQVSSGLNPIFTNIAGTQLTDGVLVNNVVNNAFSWSYLADGTSSVNKVVVPATPSLSGTYMNTGIDIFFTYDVMFDMKNGLIGFRPISQILVGSSPGGTVISDTLMDIGGIPTSLVQNGPGNTTLSADNTYSNGTIITQGSLIISSDANLGNPIGGVVFNGGSLVVRNAYSTTRSFSVFSGGGILYTSDTTTLSGTLNGAGRLQKIGAGPLIFAGNANLLYTGTIDIVQGSFIPNGNLQTATIGVGKFGILQGGTGIVGNVNSNGIVNPGLSPGILSIAGNYTQSKDGSLVIQLSSQSNGHLSVGQAAQLDGTLLPVSYQGFLPNPGSSFSIVTAGSVQGKFSRIAPLWPTLEVIPLYSPNQVEILISRNYANPQIDLNRNQRAFGKMLNAVSQDPGSLAGLLVYLNGISSSAALKKTYSRLIPSQYLSQISEAFFRTTMTLEDVEERLHDVPRCKCSCAAVDVGLEVKGLYQDQHRTHLDNGYHAKGGQVNAEINYAVSDNFLMGLYGDYTYLDATIRDHGGMIQNNSGAILGFASAHICNWYSDLIIGGLYNSYRNKRNIGMDLKAKSNNSASEVAGLLKVSRQFCFHQWIIDPNILLQTTYIYGSSFKEHGADSLNMKGKIQGANSLQAGIGINLIRYFCFLSERASSFELNADWRHECINKRYSMHSRFLEATIPFETVSSKPQKNLGFAAASINLSLTSRMDCRLTYQTLFGSQGMLQNASAGIAVTF